MSGSDGQPFMEHLYELIHRRDEISRELYVLENNLHQSEQRYSRANLQPKKLMRDSSEKSSTHTGEKPNSSSDGLIFSNSSTTSSIARDLRSRTLALRIRQEERACRLLAEATPTSPNEREQDSSDTDPEMGGIAAFEAAAERDAELRQRFKKEYAGIACKKD